MTDKNMLMLDIPYRHIRKRSTRFPPRGGLFLEACEGSQNDVMFIPVSVTVPTHVLKPGLRQVDHLSLFRSGRPEDSHLQAPSDPDVSLSTHTAHASRAVETFLLQRDAERNSLLPVTWLASPSLS